MIFATAGHVDHGKTSLVRALTGIDTDRLAEEKARGLTIDLGFAYIHKNDASIGFVDVPGHSKFISNMLAGVAAIDHALIIVAADDGPMPQTEEHIHILQLLGIEHATVVVTKIDRVTEAHLNDSKQSITTLLANSPFSQSPIFEVDSLNSVGISELSEYLWQLKTANRENRQQYFRLAIDRRFSVKGSGLVVTGSVFSGEVNLNDDLQLMPNLSKVRARGLHRQDTEAIFAGPGDRCAINLAGDVDIDQVHRGQWVTNHPALPVSTRIDVEVSLLSSELIPAKTGLPVHLHLGAQHTTGRMFLLSQRQISPGETALAQLVCDAPLSSCFGDRFVLRDQSASRTLAGGRVLNPYSVNKGRSKAQRIEQLDYLAQLKQPDALELLTLLNVASDGLDLKRLANAMNRPAFDQDFPTDDQGLSYHPENIARLEKQLVSKLEQKALNQTQLRIDLGIRESLLKLVVQNLKFQKKIELAGNEISLAGKSNSLPAPAAKLLAKVEPILTQDGLQPPVLHELAKQVNLPPPAVEKLLDSCVKQGLLVRPVKNRFFLPDTMHAIRLLAIEVAEKQGGQFSVIQFRDQSGIGRNLCIELLEHLDGKGFTKRLGDQRIIQDINR